MATDGPADVRCPCGLCLPRYYSTRSDAQLPQPDSDGVEGIMTGLACTRVCKSADIWEHVLPYLSIERLRRFLATSASLTRMVCGAFLRELDTRQKHTCTILETGIHHCFKRQMRLRYSHCAYCGIQATWYTKFKIHLGEHWETDQLGIRVVKWDYKELAQRIRALELPEIVD